MQNSNRSVYTELLQLESKILSETMEFLESVLSEAPKYSFTSKGWFKESLVVYMATMVSNKQLAEIERKLAASESEQNTMRLDLPRVTDFSTYGKGGQTINNAIDELALLSIPKEDAGLFYNAISIAKKLREMYGGRLNPNKVDMGVNYENIRKKAIQLTKDMGLAGIYPDKWCPADLYIYNDISSQKKALNADSLNIDDNSLNSMFQTNPTDTTQKILAVSLKEQVAQAGAATSFQNILSRKENYPEIGRIKNYDALTATYYAKKFLKKPNDANNFANLTYTHARAQLMKSRGVDGAAEMVQSVENIFTETLGMNLPDKTVQGRFPLSSIRSEFEKTNPSTVVVPPSLELSVDAVYSSIRRDAIREYTKLRKKFLDDLQKYGFAPPKSVAPDLNTMDMKYLLSKSGCYNAASYVLDGMFTGNLAIPKYFTKLAKQKNPFVAMVAFGIGLGGISPTYLKLTGSSVANGTAKETLFYGDGFLHLDDKSEIIINDSPTAAGFYVEFVTKVTIDRSSKSKTVAKYSVTVFYQTAGDHVVVRIKKLTGLTI